MFAHFVFIFALKTKNSKHNDAVDFAICTNIINLYSRARVYAQHGYLQLCLVAGQLNAGQLNTDSWTQTIERTDNCTQHSWTQDIWTQRHFNAGNWTQININLINSLKTQYRTPSLALSLLCLRSQNTQLNKNNLFDYIIHLIHSDYRFH